MLKVLFFLTWCLSFFPFKNADNRSFAFAHGSSQSRVSVIDMSREILYYVNRHRRSLGLKNLQLNKTESEVALQHSIDMAEHRTPFGHRGLTERAKTIARKVGKISIAAENVASGDMTAQEVVEGWLNSPGHKKNIETNFTLTGIGVAKNEKGVIYYTQIFTR